MKFNKTMFVLLGCFAAATSLNAQARDGLIYRRELATLAPSIGTARDATVQSIGIFDTKGAMTAALLTMANQENARTTKEKELKDSGAAAGTTYTYSWQQALPVANEGEMYRYFWSEIMRGLEYHGIWWSVKSTPVSYGMGYGLMLYSYNADSVNPATASANTMVRYASASIPVDFSVTFHPLESVAIYGDVAIGPLGYVMRKAKYNHFEVGSIWELTKNIQFSASYKITHDTMLESNSSSSSGQANEVQYSSNIFSLGAGLYFE